MLRRKLADIKYGKISKECTLPRLWEDSYVRSTIIHVFIVGEISEERTSPKLREDSYVQALTCPLVWGQDCGRIHAFRQ